MQPEIEAKFLDIDPPALRAKLKDLGARNVQPERLMRRKNFRPVNITGVEGWVRVRDEGDKVTMSYKQMNDRSLHGMKEINLVVNDFDTTCAFLLASGLPFKHYQETKRESWLLDGTAIEIDTWPWLPSFIEVEAPSETDFMTAIARLGFAIDRAVYGTVEHVYQQYYGVTPHEVHSWKTLEFVPVPEWLEAKRKLT